MGEAVARSRVRVAYTEPVDAAALVALKERKSRLGPRFDYDGRETFALSSDQRAVRDDIARDVELGEYRFERIPCVVCGGYSFETIASKDRYGLLCPVVACRACGLLQTNPRMDAQAYEHFYAARFASLYRGSVAPSASHFAERVSHGRRILSFLQRSRVLAGDPKDALVVDIGCSHGGVLEAFRRKGFRVCGVDVGAEYVRYGRETHGLDLRVGGIRELQLEREPDIILYCQVFEHIADPLEELRHVRGIAGQGTIVYVEVPGVRNLFPSYHMDLLRLLQNAHVYHYSKVSLANVMRLAEFVPIEMNDRVQGLFRLAEARCPFVYESDYEGLMSWLRRAELVYRIYPTPVIRAVGRAVLRGRRRIDEMRARSSTL